MEQIPQELKMTTWPVIINGVGILYDKCLCVLSRYLSPVVEICYMGDLGYPLWNGHAAEINIEKNSLTKYNLHKYKPYSATPADNAGIPYH